MNAPRWLAVALIGFLCGLGCPWHLPWERATLSIAVSLLCILVIVGPARVRR